MVYGVGGNLNTPAFFNLLVGSYHRLIGKRLIDDGQGAEWLYGEAPFVVLAHNTEPDPTFVYANMTAQRLFGYNWSEFITLPSRLSAEMAERAERQHLLDAVSQRGFITNYRGLRVTKTGQRFWMEDGAVWQLQDESGQIHGQAAAFSRWTFV
ncbi:MEKHLA domain-containing protein [Rhizobium helianthi]|uniref:MEKHLA domain-containing protein n=1 Tax=Rhizobium helianthi TaxID=1132695 RepID=A0ABW4M2R1_9HYPH